MGVMRCQTVASNPKVRYFPEGLSILDHYWTMHPHTTKYILSMIL